MFIAGEAGIGKSRLAAELCTTIERQGGRALVGVATHLHALSYEALLGAAQSALPALADAEIDDVWLRIAAGPAGSSGDSSRSRSARRPSRRRGARPLAGAFGQVFETLARRRPLLVVLEDLHWAGRDTLDAVGALARRASGAPMLLVCTYRSDEVDAALPLLAIVRALQSGVSISFASKYRSFV